MNSFINGIFATSTEKYYMNMSYNNAKNFHLAKLKWKIAGCTWRLDQKYYFCKMISKMNKNEEYINNFAVTEVEPLHCKKQTFRTFLKQRLWQKAKLFIKIGINWQIPFWEKWECDPLLCYLCNWQTLKIKPSLRAKNMKINTKFRWIIFLIGKCSQL